MISLWGLTVNLHGMTVKLEIGGVIQKQLKGILTRQDLSHHIYPNNLTRVHMSDEPFAKSITE